MLLLMSFVLILRDGLSVPVDVCVNTFLIIIIMIIIIYSCLYRDTPSPQVVVTRVPVVKS